MQQSPQLQQAEDETWFGDGFLTDRPRDNRFDPVELRPKGRAYVVGEEGGRRGIDVMSWDVLVEQAIWPMINVRNLGLKQWARLAERPESRCLIPCTELREWTPEKVDLDDRRAPLKGEMWFAVTEQPTFAVAGFR